MSPAAVDLRSDTVTKPSPAMRRAMAEADVGDDVFGEDPTVRRLEEQSAELMGQQAALFMPSGTMANQAAVAIWCRPGDEVVVEARGHVVNYELDAMSALSGAAPRVVRAPRGVLTPELIESAIFPDAYYLPRARLLALENTHAMAGGTVATPDELEACAAAGRRRGLAIHLDGARVFNAAAAAGIPARRFGALADSVMFCLSKGLGAPVGSMLCGSRDFITEARRVRKRLGGGMRQVGVLAAAGLVALEEGPPLLPEDHRRARALADGLAELKGATIEPDGVETNIVLFGTRQPAAEVVAALASRGVLTAATGASEVRCVTHRDVGDAQVAAALQAAREVLH